MEREYTILVVTKLEYGTVSWEIEIGGFLWLTAGIKDSWNQGSTSFSNTRVFSCQI